MGAPKFNGEVNNRQSLSQGTRHKTLCKKVILGNDPQLSIDKEIHLMEAAGYDYYDNIRTSSNEVIIIFKFFT